MISDFHVDLSIDFSNEPCKSMNENKWAILQVEAKILAYRPTHPWITAP